MSKTNRSIAGLASAVLGLALMGVAGYLSGEPAMAVSPRHTVAPTLAVSGGLLTFVVGRRLLTSES